MKKIREDFKFVPFISQELKRRTTKGKKTKYVEQALLRHFEWEDRNKKEVVINLSGNAPAGIVTGYNPNTGMVTIVETNKSNR